MFSILIILSIPGWCLIRLNNEFVFPDPEPLLIYCMDDQEFVANLDYAYLCLLL